MCFTSYMDMYQFGFWYYEISGVTGQQLTISIKSLVQASGWYTSVLVTTWMCRQLMEVRTRICMFTCNNRATFNLSSFLFVECMDEVKIRGFPDTVLCGRAEDDVRCMHAQLINVGWVHSPSCVVYLKLNCTVWVQNTLMIAWINIYKHEGLKQNQLSCSHSNG